MAPIDRQELDFLLFSWLRADLLLPHADSGLLDATTIAAFLDLSADLSASAFLPALKDGDTNEPAIDPAGRVRVQPRIRDAVRSYLDAGLVGATFAPESGGMGIPFVFGCASMAQFMAANIAASAYPMLSTANARVIDTFGTPAQRARFVLPQIEGKALGTMCLSETEAGSSLGDIRTRAVPDGEDTYGPRYRIFGTKMWITAADHDVTDDIVHLVLAKIPGADGRLPHGSKGISLFIVPSRIEDDSGGTVRNDFVVTGLNHKMGYRGIPNCVLGIGEGAYAPNGAPGAIGYRIGEAGQGLAIMFHMMNEARVNVGLGGGALAYRGYRLAADYAAQRLQGRPRGAAPDSAPVPIAAHPDVKRMLLAQKAYAEGALALSLYCARLVDEARLPDQPGIDATTLLGFLTPIAKSWPSEWGLRANDLAIQVHGGYGYTRDFDVEQLYRDNRLNPIHEGTTGIQAIDLIGRKTYADQGAGFRALAARIVATIDRARVLPELEAQALALQSALARVEACVAHILSSTEGARLSSATAFLSATGHLVVGWLWLDQARTVIDGGLGDRFDGKRWACRYFMEYELPRIDGWLAPVFADSDLLEAAPASFQ